MYIPLIRYSSIFFFFFMVIYTDRTGKIGRNKGIDHIDRLVEVRFDKKKRMMSTCIKVAPFLFENSSIVNQLCNLIILKEKKISILESSGSFVPVKVKAKYRLSFFFIRIENLLHLHFLQQGKNLPKDLE